jgi:uncharacterized protein (TIGR02001 family)
MNGQRRTLVALALVVVSTPALAQNETLSDAGQSAENSELGLSANVALVSDYRFRGISLSDRAPALQGGLDFTGEHFFIGTWASTIAEYGGADVEVDVYAGVQGSSDTVGWTAGAYAYLYPAGEAVNYVELMGSTETYIGPATLGVTVAYVPEQRNVEAANKYIGASGSLDVGAGVGLVARGGYEDGFYDGKWDWELGATYTRGPVTASLSYIDSNFGGANEEGRLARAGIVASLLASF